MFLSNKRVVLQLTSVATEEVKPLRFTDSPSYAHASLTSPSPHTPHASPSSYAPASTSGRGTALSSQASPRLADLYLDYREHFPHELCCRDDLSPESDELSLSQRYWAPRCAGPEQPRLRSSLKKHRRPSPPPAAPDSPSETDSSYASARDASGSARVRFSPDARRS